MSENIILKEPLIIIANKTVEASNFLIDPVFIISTITLLIAIAALCFSVVIFRPKVHVEIKNILFKELLRSYEIVVSNNGNVMAKDIKIEFDDNLKNALNHNCSKKNNNGFGSFNFIENNLKKEFKYLPASKEVKGLFITTENNDENTSPLLFDKPFTIYVSYTNSITRRRYKKQPIILELKKSDWITDYNMTDNLGYDLNRLLDELKKMNTKTDYIYKEQIKIVKSIESEKYQNANKIFDSLNNKEKTTLLNLLGDIYSKEDLLFIENLKIYMENNKNDIVKKLKKLNLDEFDYFLKIIRDFRDGV